jgi:hypothetical protein
MISEITLALALAITALARSPAKAGLPSSDEGSTCIPLYVAESCNLRGVNVACYQAAAACSRRLVGSVLARKFERRASSRREEAMCI